LLDDGRLTDNQGRTVDFKNTIVIMTSNIGSPYLIENIKPDGTIPDHVKETVENEMKRYFRPEFLNRIDDVVIFSPLTEEQIMKIIDMAMAHIVEKLADRNITVTLTDSTKRYIAREAYTPAYGARPVNGICRSTLRRRSLRNIKERSGTEKTSPSTLKTTD
jgi:ATP-dependent Clp protease ATP-binding subunit ClpB